MVTIAHSSEHKELHTPLPTLLGGLSRINLPCNLPKCLRRAYIDAYDIIHGHCAKQFNPHSHRRGFCKVLSALVAEAYWHRKYKGSSINDRPSARRPVFEMQAIKDPSPGSWREIGGLTYRFPVKTKGLVPLNHRAREL